MATPWPPNWPADNPVCTACFALLDPATRVYIVSIVKRYNGRAFAQNQYTCHSCSLLHNRHRVANSQNNPIVEQHGRPLRLPAHL